MKTFDRFKLKVFFSFSIFFAFFIATGYAQITVSYTETPVSIDGIIGLAQVNADQPGYYVDKNSGQAGGGGSGGDFKRYSVVPVIGFSLPTLPAGHTIFSVTLHYNITAYRYQDNPNFTADSYLLNSSDPSTTSTDFYYMGPSDTNTNVKFIGATDLPDGATNTSITADPVIVCSQELTGDVLTAFKALYGGGNAPTQSEAFVRFNRSSADTTDTTLGDNQIYERFFIDTSAANLYLEITSTGPAVQSTVTYDGNGSTDGNVPVDANSPYDYDTTVTVLGNTGNLVNTGLTFVGWNTAADGSGTSYAANDTFKMPASDVVLYAQWAPYALTLTIADTTVSEAAGPAATIATVTRNTDTTNALTVTLSSSDTTEATVPASVEIPAGQASATFNINAVNDQDSDDTQIVTITATATGYLDGTDTIDISDDETPDAFQEGVSPTAAYTMDATYIRERNAADNQDGDPDKEVIVGVTSTPDVLRGLLEFDISTIPAGDTIGEVSLILTTRDSAGGSGTSQTFNVYSYAYDIDETAATWNQPDVGGADVAGGTSGTLLTSATFDSKNQNEVVTFADSTAFRAAVTEAVSNGHPLRMIMRNSNESTTTTRYARFAADSYATASYRPKLLIKHSPPSTLSVNATDASEPSTEGLFTLTTTKQFAGDTTVNLTVGGTAAGGTDYTAIATTVTFPASQDTVTIPVEVIDDAIVEGDETVIVTLGAGTGYAVAASPNDTATVNISEDDSATISIAATTQASEPSTDGLFTLTTTKQFAGDTTVNMTVGGTAAGGTDYTAITTTVTFPASQDTVTIPVEVLDDSLVEGTETVILTLATGTGYSVAAATDDTATVNISDDDSATISIAATTQASEPSTDGLFTLTTTKQFAGDTTVNLTVGGTAAGGTDYTAIATTVTFPASQDTVSIPVEVLDDSLVEGNETVILTLATGTGYSVGAPTTATVNINDDDTAGVTVSAISGDTVEDGTTANITVVLTSEPIADVTIGISSDDTTEGTVSPASLTFTAGNWNSAQTVTVTGVDDLIVDGNVTYKIVTAAATSADANYESINPADVAVTNLDNDIPALTLTISTASVSEADGAAVTTATVTRNTDTASALTVTLASSDTSEVTVPATVEIAAGSAAATFDINAVDDAIADGTQTVTITASDAGHTSGTDTVDVTDDDTAALTLSIVTASISEVDGAAATTATVTRNTDTTNPLTVTLTSSDLTEATVPATVEILAGQASATFDINAVDDGDADGTQTVTITASEAGHTSGTATLDVKDDESVIITFTTDGTAGATLSGTTTQEVAIDGDCTSVEAIAPTDWKFVNWTNGGVEYSTTNPLTATGVSTDMTLVANFIIIPNNPPVIESQSFTMDENAANGTEIGTLQSTDADNDTLTFSIISGNSEGVFAVDPATGVITVADNSTVDYTTTPFYSLTVQVSDGKDVDTCTVTITLGNFVTQGLIFTVKASEVDIPNGGKMTKFTKKPKVIACYYDPLSGQRKTENLKIYTKIPARDGSDVTEIICGWNKKVCLYDKKEIRTANKSGVFTHEWLTENPIEKLLCTILVSPRTDSGVKFIDDISRQIKIVGPEITSVENINKTVVTDVSTNSLIVLRGKHFGTKAPKVWLEYKDEKGRIKAQRLKVQKEFDYDDYNGKENRSCMDIISGESCIKVEMPKKWWKGWEAGTYNLVIDNCIGIDTATVNTGP